MSTEGEVFGVFDSGLVGVRGKIEEQLGFWVHIYGCWRFCWV